MAIVSNALPGGVGLILDQEPAELGPAAWSRGLNMRFQNGAVGPVRGDMQLTASTEQMEWGTMVSLDSSGVATWMLTSDTKAWSLVAGTLTNITPAGVTGTANAALQWSGGVLGGVAFCNNGLQKPWAWIPGSADMVELANWQAGVTAAVLRPFKQYMVALDITKSGTRYSTLVKWSHPADPGAVPPSWDEADPTKDAGEAPLAETMGACVDIVPMKDIAIVYKTDSVWGMQWIGGVYIFRFYKIFGEFGMPKKDCAVEYASGRHFVFTGTDAIVHDGNTMKSVATGRVKKLFATIGVGQLGTCFVQTNPAQNEVWLCYRQADDGLLAADTALVYNHLDDTWGMRKLADYRYIGVGAVDPPGTVVATWGAQSSGWNAAGELWGEVAVVPGLRRLLGLGTLAVNWVEGTDTPPQEASLERLQIGIPTRSRTPPDLSTMKFVKRVWPRLKGSPGQRVIFTFGASDQVMDSIRWKAPITFTLGSSLKIDLTLSGKLMSLRVENDPESPVQAAWTYHGMDLEVQTAGEN